MTKLVHVRDHLQRCASCAAILEELRVVDGILETARPIEPAPNFTFATMAEIRSMAAPRVAPTRTLAFIGIYLAAVWAVVGVWFVIAGTSARIAFTTIAATATHALASASIAATGVLRPLAHGSPLTTVFIGALVLDLALALAFFIVYRIALPRVAARLAHVRVREVV